MTPPDPREKALAAKARIEMLLQGNGLRTDVVEAELAALEAALSPPVTAMGGEADEQDAWLIVKRDLYFRADARGYTGFRDEAGRYDLETARSYADRSDGEITIVRLSEAPEFRKVTYSDLLINRLLKQRDEARAALRAQAQPVPAEVIEKVDTALELAIGYPALLASGVDKLPITRSRAAADCEILGDAMDALAPYRNGRGG